jgi:hypothetical protein
MRGLLRSFTAWRMAFTSSPLAASLTFSMAAWIGALSASDTLSALSFRSFSSECLWYRSP